MEVCGALPRRAEDRQGRGLTNDLNRRLNTGVTQGRVKREKHFENGAFDGIER